MENYSLGLFSIPGKPDSTNPNNNITSSNDRVISAAQRFGIDISKFCTYDENGNIRNIDTVALNALVEAEKAKEQKTANQPQNDYFCRTQADAQLTNQEQAEANTCQSEIDAEYTDALNQYANFINNASTIDAEAGQITENWDSIKDEALSYIGVNVTSTTVLEGGKEFLNKIYSTAAETKNYQNDKANEVSEEPTGDVALESNPIEVHTANPFTDPYYTSAYETFGAEEEEEVAV